MSTTPYSSRELAEHVAAADAALGAAGHVVEPRLRELAIQVFTGQLTAAEGDRQALDHIEHTEPNAA